MSDTTIVYYSDNKLDPQIDKVVREYLVKAANGKPIISVTQKPIDLGTNICVGDIGTSWINIFKQVVTGCEAATTKYVAMAEADVLYLPEHYDFIPPRDDTFYYNENCWFVQWGGNHTELNGMYSKYWTTRMALSQMICDRELMVKAYRKRLELLTDHQWLMKRGMGFAGEPGLTKLQDAQKLAASGKPVSLINYIKEYFEDEKADIFVTTHPNLDIKHANNFTGPKRGKSRRYELEPWGRFEAVIGGVV